MTKHSKRLSAEQSPGVSPAGHAWMSASAGTGKTEVLTARILRLLLAGARPESILAMTYTKAAAAEMTARIRKRLASWVQMKRQDLSRELYALHVVAKHDEQVLRQAQTLFARVIDAPGGGLAIQTIHGFCQSLLAAFPEEAGLAPGFRAIDDVEVALLHQDTLNDLLTRARDQGDSGFLDSVARLATRVKEDDLRKYLINCAAAYRQIAALPAGLKGWLRLQFDLPLTDVPDDWLVDRCVIDRSHQQWLELVRASLLGWGAQTGKAYAETITDWLGQLPVERAATIGDLLSCFCTKKGELRNIYSNDKQCGNCFDEAEQVGAWLSGLVHRHTQMIASDRMADALDVGRRYARAYVERKQRKGLVDYDDLIAIALALVRDDSDAQWIKYKLDRRIDHVLVDEAQDTNSQQWGIVCALTEEFFAGEGASGSTGRTMFAVGDVKQAIYGFQGTSPDYFQAMESRFAALATNAGHAFQSLALTTSYRSSSPVLDIVDDVIAANTPVKMGLLSDDTVQHRSSDPDAPGRVVLWPLERGKADDDEEDGDNRTSDNDEGDGDDDAERWIDQPTRRVATKIARTVRHWIDHGIDGEPVVPSDILILVRKRAEMASLIVSRLQSVQVAVAGVDRLKLRLPIVVQDLMSAARFALQPLDSLNLASLLVSPLIGWSHDEIARRAWRLNAHGREEMPLWTHLRQQDDLGDALAPLFALLNMVGYRSPYQFFEELLSGPLQGRARLLARLGPEARDPIEELLNQALAFETREGQSLNKFVQWFDSGNLEIKRELEDAGGDVRVMTVHGAKGLQGKIVILADAAHKPSGQRSGTLQWSTDDGDKVPILLPSKEGNAHSPALTDQIERAAREDSKESLRLLYVAMTRAERMLFVAGALPKSNTAPPDNWYEMIERAVRARGVDWAENDPVWGRHLSHVGRGKPVRAAAKLGEVQAPAPTLPTWAGTAPAPEQRPPKPLSPSADEERAELLVAMPPSSPAEGNGRLRGILMHSLFERLPAVPLAARQGAADRWLSVHAPQLSEQDRDDMIRPVLSVMADDRFAAVFSPASLAEVPFSALVGDRVIAGTIDRLIVDDGDVHIVDFKTGQQVPEAISDIPPAYLRQMAAYAAAMAVVFPGKAIHASLLYTGGPQMISLPDAVLSAHQPSLVP